MSFHAPRWRQSPAFVALALALLCAGMAKANEDVAPGILPIVVEKTPSRQDKDARKLAALRARVVKELVAARPDLVDLAEGEEPVIGRPAKGVETLVSTYEGLATHLVTFESKGKGKRLTLTARVVVVETHAVLAAKTVRPLGADRRTAASAIRTMVLGSLPTTATAGTVDGAAGETHDTPTAHAGGTDTAHAGGTEPSSTEPATAAAAPAISGDLTDNRVEDGVEPDEGSLWPFVTGGVVGVLALVSVSALAAGAAVGVWALLDSNAYVAAPDQTELKDSSLLKGNVADGLYVVGGLAALAAGAALTVGLIVGFTDDE